MFSKIDVLLTADDFFLKHGWWRLEPSIQHLVQQTLEARLMLILPSPTWALKLTTVHCSDRTQHALQEFFALKIYTPHYVVLTNIYIFDNVCKISCF